MKSKFFKYRQRFDVGPGEWEYIEHYDKETLADELRQEYDWTDKYRGCEIEEVSPPKEWFEEQIESFKNHITSYQKRIESYTELIK